MPDVHEPVVMYHGPTAEHDYACPVCQRFHAVLDLNTGVFQPCWNCQRDGWRTKTRWWRRRA